MSLACCEPGGCLLSTYSLKEQLLWIPTLGSPSLLPGWEEEMRPCYLIPFHWCLKVEGPTCVPFPVSAVAHRVTCIILSYPIGLAVGGVPTAHECLFLQVSTLPAPSKHPVWLPPGPVGARAPFLGSIPHGGR